MPGRGRPPKPPDQRRNAHTPTRGEWQRASGTGWQHGPVPRPPDGLLPASRQAWRTWFRAWYAAFWEPADVPGLRVVVGLYNEVESGRFERMAEWRMWASTYGITPAGQQERRWLPPEVATRPQPATAAAADPYGHLRIIDGDA